MKVSVVTKVDDDEGYARRTVTHVFSSEKLAIEYCDKVDPSEETHNVDDFIVLDSLPES